MPRKTADEKREEFRVARQRVWDSFFPKLQAVRTHEEGVRLLSEAVPENSPGRCYYSNFGFFMHSFSPPFGASTTELREYLRLVGCFDDEGALVEGPRERLEDALNLAISTRHLRP